MLFASPANILFSSTVIAITSPFSNMNRANSLMFLLQLFDLSSINAFSFSLILNFKNSSFFLFFSIIQNLFCFAFFLDFLAIALKKINLVEQACDAWGIVTKWKCTHELHRLLKTFANKLNRLATICIHLYIFVLYIYIKVFAPYRKFFQLSLNGFFYY